MVIEDRVKFEERNFNNLIDKFIDKNMDLWNKFVDKEYNEQAENEALIDEDKLYEEERDLKELSNG
jgi:hypothetical protein